MVFGTSKQAKYISTSIVDLGRNVYAVVRPLTLQHGITFLAALGCEVPVWNNEDNDSHALPVSVKSLLEGVAGSHNLFFLMHVSEGINLGFCYIMLSSL